MKVYYLRLSDADFTKSSFEWTSNVFDLYNNASYKNYSTTKSQYELDPLGNRTWVGLTQHSESVTSSGIIEDGRFIDYTGRIDLLDFSYEFTNFEGQALIAPLLDVYTSPDSSSEFPNEWASQKDISSTRGIFLIGSYRYVKLVLRFGDAIDTTSVNGTMLIRVEIDTPVMVPRYTRTTSMQNKFPEWMAMREVDSTSATPDSLGGKLLNAVAGEWLDHLNTEITAQRLEQFVSTADESQVAWVYKMEDVSEEIYSVVGDSTSLPLVATASLQEFYELSATERGYYWDEDNSIIYTNTQHFNLKINGVDLGTTAHHHVWNWFDEFGLMVDLHRLPLETNANFKLRILDVYRNKPGVGIEAFKKALRRELNLWESFGVATGSDEGATPIVVEIADLEADNTSASPFVFDDGIPTDRFIALVDELADQYPTTWGYFRWSQFLWDAGGEGEEAYSVLPYRYDNPLPNDDQVIQSGVGDGSDLMLIRPDVITGPREFDARLKVRGRQRVQRFEYPTTTYDIEIYGQADHQVYTNPTITEWFTVELQSLPVVEEAVVTRQTVDASTTTGKQFHAIYAIPSDGIDRNLDTNDAIANAIEGIQKLYIQETDKRLRWSRANGRVTISFVQLPKTTVEYKGGVGGVNGFTLLRNDLIAAGFNHADKNYAVWYEGTNLQGNIEKYDKAGELNVAGKLAVIYLTAGEGPLSVGVDTELTDLADGTMAHTIFHTLGAIASMRYAEVSEDFLEDISGDHLNSKTKKHDIMGANLPPRRIDKDRKYYYGHTGDWLDTSDQSFWEEVRLTSDSTLTTSGNTFHIIYAVPSDETDREYDLNGAILRSINNVQRLFETRGNKQLKLTLRDDEIAISFVRLPKTKQQYFGAVGGPFSSLISDLQAAGFTHATRNYIVYYEGESPSNLYGQGTVGTSTTSAGQFAIAYLQVDVRTEEPDVFRDVGEDTPSGRRLDVTVAHEVFHNLGAVQPSAPNYSNFHVLQEATPNSDIMATPSVAYSIYPFIDINNNDYFNHSGGWLDTADSAFLQAAPTAILYYHSFQLSSKSDVDIDNALPTSNSWGVYDFIDEDGNTEEELIWHDSLGETHESLILDLENVSRIRLHQGRWDAELATPAFTDVPTLDRYTAWFSSAPATLLQQASSGPITGTNRPNVVMSSKVVTFGIEKWQSEPQLFTITMNGKEPQITTEEMIIFTPYIYWPPDDELETPANKEIIIQNATLSSGLDETQLLFPSLLMYPLDGEYPQELAIYGATTTDVNGDQLFLPDTLLNVNGNATWNNGQKTFDPDVTSFTFTTGTSDLYPIWASVWVLFESSQTDAMSGIVDENGPWRNGQASVAGNTNFNWTDVNVTRLDFDVSDTTDFVITWMGVEIVDNARVIAWLDTNTVKPAFDDGTDVVYPDEVIQERFNADTGQYYFDPIIIRVRLRPGVDPEWFPQIHSGWFYDRSQEYYLYAQPSREVALDNEVVLSTVARQGAPIIVSNGIQDAHLLLTGIELDYVYTYDLSSLIFLNDLEIIIKLKIDPWVPPTTISLVEKWGENIDEQSFIFKLLNNGLLQLEWLDNGSIRVAQSLTGTDSADVGSIQYLRVVLDADDTFGNTKVSFYSSEEGQNWVDLGSVLLPGPATITSSTSPVGIGLSSGFGGQIYEVEIKDAINQLANPRFDQADSMPFTDSKGNLWQSNGESDIEKPLYLRHVAFVDDNGELTLTNQEIVKGTGVTKLYSSYSDIYNIFVIDLETDAFVNTVVFTPSNEISLFSPSVKDRDYQISYTVKNSFFVDNDFVEDDTQKTHIRFDTAPTTLGLESFIIDYETSIFDPASQLDLPLNTFYTTTNEGYVYISFDEFKLNQVEIRLSPSKIIADGLDFILITIRSLDENGNVKPNQSFNLSTTFGGLDSTSVITNDDGFATVKLLADSGTTNLTGTLTVTGAVNTTAPFEISSVIPRDYRLTALPTAEQIPADGMSMVVVHGKLESGSFTPIPNEAVQYRKGRSVHEIFTMSRSTDPAPASPPWPDTGQVQTDAEGRFTLGPFISATPFDPGYWFVSAEAMPASPNYVGDVVFWHEYPDSQYGIEDLNGLPIQAMQMRNTVQDATPYSHQRRFPVNYDDATPNAGIANVDIIWEPPRWYAINRYKQYQLGLLGTSYYSVDHNKLLNEAHPDYKDL